AWRGQTRILLKDYRGALEDLDEALRRDGRDPWALTWRAESWRRLGYCARALKDFDGALDLSPNLSWALAGRGFCLSSLGRAQEALGHALKVNPGSTLALVETACWWDRNGQKLRARRVLEQAARLSPGRIGSPRRLDLEAVERLLGADDPSLFFSDDQMIEF